MRLKYHVVLNYTLERREDIPDQIGIELSCAKKEALPVEEILLPEYTSPKEKSPLIYRGRVVQDILSKFRFSLSRPYSSERDLDFGFWFYDESAGEFFDAFVAPIEKNIPGNPDEQDDLHLLIITPEELLPFPVHISFKPVAPTSKEKKAILFDYNVSYIPSTLLERLVGAPSKMGGSFKKVVILCSHRPIEQLPPGFPPNSYYPELPGAKKEAELLFKFWSCKGIDVEILSDDPNKKPLKGFARQASKEEVMEAIKGASLFIYIGHTVVDNKEVGWIIAGRELERDLISGEFIEQNQDKISHLLLAHLDSCTSAIGRLLDFRDSLALSLLRSGVPSVIATQWEVSDKSKSRLEVVEGFYQRFAQGKPLDQVLKEAEVEVLRRYRGKRSYELSGCILLGSYLNPLRM